MSVNIDGTWYQADDEVVKRMQEIYDTMIRVIQSYELLESQVRYMRLKQMDYFASRNSPKFIKNERLQLAKVAERNVDILIGEKKEKKQNLPAQGTLL